MQDRVESQRKDIDLLRGSNEALRASNELLKNQQIDTESMDIAATALELRIENLALKGEIAEYAKAKEAYENIFGRSWVEDD